jgi:hypothetical protein
MQNIRRRSALKTKDNHMTAQSPQENQVQETKVNDKELNFRALEQKYQRQLEQERAGRLEAERQVRERMHSQSNDDDDSEPYVDNKKLNKKLAQFGEQTKQQTQTEINNAVQIALKEERKSNWLKNNSDFYEVLQHAEKLGQKDPDLAESLLEMPEGFERQKLVYKNIKALGLHRPEVRQASIQEKVDANRRSPFYQPSGVGSAPYASSSDFSVNGQKQAYDKMQELKNKLRI